MGNFLVVEDLRSAEKGGYFIPPPLSLSVSDLSECYCSSSYMLRILICEPIVYVLNRIIPLRSLFVVWFYVGFISSYGMRI